jgi:hypothetical protein
MKVFIYLLIMILSFIIINHLLTTVKEGFQCVSTEEAAQFHQNKNLINEYEKQLQAFDTYVSSLEKQVADNGAQITANQETNRASKLAVCPKKCPGTHALGTLPNDQQTEICKCHCCSFVDATLGNYCTGPFATGAPTPSDIEAEKWKRSGVPEPGPKGSVGGPSFSGRIDSLKRGGSGGYRQAEPGDKAKSGW